jgi:hypothetical protein
VQRRVQQLQYRRGGLSAGAQFGQALAAQHGARHGCAVGGKARVLPLRIVDEAER